MYANSEIKLRFTIIHIDFYGDECNNISTIRAGDITLGRFPPKYNNSNPYTLEDIYLDVIYSDLTLFII